MELNLMQLLKWLVNLLEINVITKHVRNATSNSKNYIYAAAGTDPIVGILALLGVDI